MNNKVKKTFKILLDSNHGASYNGPQFNATYYTDLTKILNNAEDFNKSYLMYCAFKSRADTVANNQITNNEVYYLTIDLFKGLNLYQYNNRSGNTVYIVPVLFTNEAVSVQTYFDMKDYDNMPILINDLKSVSKIYLNLSLASTSSTFSPTAPANSRYSCLLTFVEC